MARTKNKMKNWRRVGNKVVIQVPRETNVVDTDGNETKQTTMVPHVLRGRQYKQMMNYVGKAPASGLMKNLLTHAGLDIIEASDVIVPTANEEAE